LPEVDIKQRLTLDKGYGVAEFAITASSNLRDRTLAELALGDRDVMVLSVQRGGIFIPNPRGDQKLLLGDQILCYGKNLALKQLIPRDGTGRRRGEKKKRKTIETGCPSRRCQELENDSQAAPFARGSSR
jgi:ribosomal protein S6--L-glutamate ligase